MIMASRKNYSGVKQKNMRFTPEFAAALEQFAFINGYDERKLFKLAIRMATDLTHEERMQLFADLDQWEAQFIEQNAPPEVERKPQSKRAG